MKLFVNFLDFFGNCWGIFGIFLDIFLDFLFEFFREFFPKDFFGGIFLGEIFWEDFFREDFFRGFFWEDYWEDFFGRNSLFTLELTCLSRFCLNGEGRRRKNFRSLEVRVQAHRT